MRGPEAYSRFVRVMRIALPLLAILLLSTIFLTGRDTSFDPDEFLEGIAEGERTSPGVLAPRLTGTLGDGTPYTIEAQGIELAGEGRFIVSDMRVRIDDRDGPTTMTAPAGDFDAGTRVLLLDGPVAVDRPGGERVTAGAARVDLDSSRLTLRDGVVITMDGVSITAPRLVAEAVAQSGRDGQNTVVRLDGGVRTSIGSSGTGGVE
ncbi:MAG: hypothetical protein ACPGID_00520 [Rubricella sp.]